MTEPGVPVPSLSQLKAWSHEHFFEHADWCDAEAARWEAVFTELCKRVKDTEWEGEAKDNAVRQRELDLGKVKGTAEALTAAAKLLRLLGDNVRFAKVDALREVEEATEAGYIVHENLTVTDTAEYTSWDQAKARRDKAREFATCIREYAVLLVKTDQFLADKVAVAAAPLGKLTFDDAPIRPDGQHGHVLLVDDHNSKDSDIDRRHNQEDAFAKVYGRAPVSDNDWRMAAALDPHSYDPKYHGVPPQLVAGRFAPQPGQGVVRSNMFIPADQVQNIFKDGKDFADGRFAPRNFGDNRGPSATADPEASRVSVFVDYDHGLVVVRQNPTSNVDGARGGAAAGVPNVHVVQAPDGRMTIDYNAHDAYENPVGEALGVTVNGRVTLSPHDDGTVGLGGSTTIYPSMESYQYRDGHAPVQLQWDAANSGSAVGPGTSLERHHWVGDATIPPVRPDMPSWKWELENASPFQGDPFLSHTTQLTDPFRGGIPSVGTGR